MKKSFLPAFLLLFLALGMFSCQQGAKELVDSGISSIRTGILCKLSTVCLLFFPNEEKRTSKFCS